MTNKPYGHAFLLCAAAALASAAAAAAQPLDFASPASAAGGFWSQDVWRDPERPFLFYGSGDEEQKTEANAGKNNGKAAGPDNEASKEAARKAAGKNDEGDDGKGEEKMKDLASLTTIEALQDEVKSRLSRAVMNPTPANMSAYLEANAFLMAKAGAFAESWREVLLQRPQYDWTAQHPTVNFASTELSRAAARRVTEALSTLNAEWGFIFFGDDSELTRLMLPLAQDFSSRHGFETLFVSVVPENPLMPGARLDAGQSRRIAGGLTLFPALVLVHKDDRDLREARLAATGVVDIAELGRRVVRLVQAHEEARMQALAQGAGEAGLGFAAEPRPFAGLHPQLEAGSRAGVEAGFDESLKGWGLQPSPSPLPFTPFERALQAAPAVR